MNEGNVDAQQVTRVHEKETLRADKSNSVSVETQRCCSWGGLGTETGRLVEGNG